MSPKPRQTKRRPFAELHDDDYARLDQVLDAYPVGESSWWRGIAEGRYPEPVKLSPKVSAWKVGKIRALMASCEADDL